MAGINRISSASALAALSISVFRGRAAGTCRTAEARRSGNRDRHRRSREPWRKASRTRREAAQVIESIVAEDIGKLPDNNVIEALQRVTGVQVTNRGGGEADGIAIRGLPDITTTWNGRNVFTGVGRSLALQDVPANLIGRIDVFKTRSSEQIETGLAGQIDVRTRRPFDLPGLEVSLNARGTMQDQRDDSLDPNVSFLAANQWDGDDGRFGALFNVSYGRTRWRDQSVIAGAHGAVRRCATRSPMPAGLHAATAHLQRRLRRLSDCRAPDRGLPTAPGSTLDFDTGPGTSRTFPYLLARDALFASDFEGDRERPAANIALQWAPNDTSEYTFEAFYQGYREKMFNNLHFTFADWWGALGPNPASTITMYPDTNIIKTRVVGSRSASTAAIPSNSRPTPRLCAERQVGNGRTPHAGSGRLVPGQRVRHAIHRGAHRTRARAHHARLQSRRRHSVLAFHQRHEGAIRSLMLDPGVLEHGPDLRECRPGSRRCPDHHTRRRLQTGRRRAASSSTLSFGVRFDDRGTSHRQPVTDSAHRSSRRRARLRDDAGRHALDQRRVLRRQRRHARRAGWWPTATTSWTTPMKCAPCMAQPAGGPTLVRSYEVEERT